MELTLATLLVILILSIILLYKVNKKWGYSTLFLCFIVFCFGFYTSTKEDRVQTIAAPEENLSDVTFDDHDTPSLLDQKKSHLLDVPIVSQLPELPRGCEVTSLAMLLAHAGVIIDKMELALNIKKDLTPYEEKDGKIYFGHPNNGFVGDMYNKKNPGLGVYYKPIMELAEQYLPGRMIDLTGEEFFTIEKRVSEGFPVWVIINTRYQRLPEKEFITWQTPEGPTEITYREHAAVITGFDASYVYVNDPLTVEKNKQVPKDDFIKAWVQMGRQAITYTE